MPRVRMAMAGFVLAAVFGLPQSASASIIDFIWEMSGPQMIGFNAQCEFDVHNQRYECFALDAHIAGERNVRSERRLWLTLTGGVYFATGKDSEMRPFSFGKVQMFSYEPTLDVRSFSRGNVKIDHGVIGLSYFFLTGSDFKNFDNVGMKLVPISVTINRLTISYTVRIFPNGFTTEQFGGDPAATTHEGREVVTGLAIGYRW